MRIFTRFFVARLVPVALLLLSVSLTMAAATITETFNRLSASTTTVSSGNFTGVGGVAWEYERVRKVSGLIDGTSAELRRRGSGILTATRPTGLATLRYTIRTAPGAWHTTAEVRVFVNGVSYGKRSPQQTDVPKTVTISGINVDGNVTVRFESVGSLEAIVDNVEWVETTGGGTPAPSAGPDDLGIDAEGWSIVAKSSDTREIYVSSSQGINTNDGRTKDTPVRSLDKAFSLVRDGYPDHVLLKRGDTWTDQTFGRLKNLSGRSGKERLVVSYYGSGPRPKIRTNNSSVLTNSNSDHLAIIGIEFYNYTADPGNSAFVDYRGTTPGIRPAFNFQGVFMKNILFEDCKISYYENAMSFFTKSDPMIGDAYKNIDIRRNIILRQYERGTTYAKVKSQGIFVSHTEDFLLEENFFDHNGWNENFDDTQANKFNHNVYLSTDNAGPMVVRGNVLSRGAAHGLQLRSGGTAEYNAMIANCVGMNLGYKDNKPRFYFDQTNVRHNVVTDGRLQDPILDTKIQTGAVWGFWKQLIDEVSVKDNIVANIQSGTAGNRYPYKEMSANEFGSGNIAYNWVNKSVPASDPGWFDPNRDKDTYVTMLGYPSYDAWITAASNRGIKSFPADFTARRYVDYIREGFTVTSNATAPSFSSAASVAPTDLPDRIYPNPTGHGTVTVECQEVPTAIRLLSIDGRLLRETYRTANRTTIDVSGLAPGLYLVEIAYLTSRATNKLVLHD